MKFASILMLVAVMAFRVVADEVYQINSNLPSGLDLLGLSGYCHDRLMTPPANASYTVTGAVTYDVGVSVEQPFTILGGGGEVKFANAGTFPAIPLRLDGIGRTIFPDVIRTISAGTASSLVIANGAYVQYKGLNVSDASGVAEWTMNSGRLAFDTELNVGVKGGAGLVRVLGGACGTTLDTWSSSDKATLNLGNSDGASGNPSKGTVIISNATLSVVHVGLGYDCPTARAAEMDPADYEIELKEKGVLKMYRLRKYNGRTARIVFAGGYIESALTYPNQNGWLSSEGFGRLLLEGVRGKPIRFELGYQFARPPFCTYGSADTSIETKGDCDLLFAGWNGGLTLSAPSLGRILYHHSGSTRFKANGGTFTTTLGTANALPYGSRTGGVILEGTTSNLKLAGLSQRVNGITGTGTLDATVAGATLTFGTEDASGTFDVACADGSSFASVKTGSGTLVVRKSLPGPFVVDAGKVEVPAGAGTVSVDSLTVAADAAVEVSGAALSVNDITVAGSFTLAQGGTWAFGGDSELAIDVTGFHGDFSSVWRKTGSGTVVLSGSSDFAGTLIVEDGSVEFASGAQLHALTVLDLKGDSSMAIVEGLFRDYRTEIRLAEDVSLTVPSGINLPVAALQVAGDYLEGGKSYGGEAMAGTVPLRQLSGAGTLCAAVRSPVWNGGAGSDTSMNTLANWQGLQQLPNLVIGSLSPVFATGGNRADAPFAVSFRGLTFSSAVEAFTVGATGSGSVEVGPDGIFVETAGGLSDRAYVIDAPLTIKGVQTWSVSDNAQAILSITKPLSGDGAVTKTGSGRLVVSGGEGDYTGDFTLAKGPLELVGRCPLGSGGTLSASVPASGTQVILKGAEVANGVQLSCPNPSSVGYNYNIFWSFEGSNVVSGPVAVKDYSAYIFVRDGSSLTFEGGVKFDASWGTFLRNDWTSGMRFAPFVFRSRPITTGYLLQTSGSGAVKVVLDAAGNVFSAEAGKEFKIDKVNHALEFGVPDAIAAGAHVWNGKVSFKGNSQHIVKFATTGAAAGATFDSDREAMLYVTNQASATTLSAVFTGKLGLSKSGAGVMTVANAEATTTGPLEVVSGKLALAGSTWPNATNIAIGAAGVLSVDRDGVFNRKSWISAVSGAKLEIATGTSVHCAELVIDGERTEIGVYTAMTATGKVKALLEGCGGSIRVRGSSPGFMTLIR